MFDVAAIRLSALLASSALAFNAIKYPGAAYLLYPGVRTLVGGDDQPEERPDDVGIWRVYVQGVVVNALNPRMALFFLAFVPQFVDPSKSGVAAGVFVLGVVFFLIGLCVDRALIFVHWGQPLVMQPDGGGSGFAFVMCAASIAVLLVGPGRFSIDGLIVERQARSVEAK